MSVDATTQAKIRKQVEFYFGDSNLPYDKFLWQKHQQNGGWIPIKTIADFKKMKMICSDLDSVVAALKAEPSELIETNDDDQVRRKTEVVEQNHFGRSIYAKPFAIEKATDDSTADLLNLQDEIQEFFEQHGKVLSVRMRKQDGRNGAFKGSVFVEFSSSEEATKVAAMDLEFKGKKLEMMTKAAYADMKSEQYKDTPKPYKKKAFTFNAFKEQNHKNKTNKGGKRSRDSAVESNDDDSKRQRTEEKATEEKAEAEQ